MLDSRETFEKYERRTPKPVPDARLACDYRRQPDYPTHPNTNYNVDPGMLACELRSPMPPHRPDGFIKTTAYIPETGRKKFPIGLILTIAICVPIFIVVVLFVAIWLQELGWI